MYKKIIKIIRFTKIYGPSRTFTKVAGRMRFGSFLSKFSRAKEKDISMVGCGQFAFSTISYFLKKQRGNRFLSCYDTDSKHAASLGEFYGYEYIEKNYQDLLNRKPKFLYIASNHYTHTEYAIQALARNINVYVEKPISVTRDQFKDLLNAVQQSNASIYAGYNRPFSGAIIDLGAYIKDKRVPMSINYFISGHKIESDHWYRDSKEGTRICGNVGHWLDLTVHLFSIRGQIPEQINISIAYSSADEPDDNIAITLTTELHDIVTIMLTSRTEPFEGINESINLQCDNVISKIDDFRTQTLWIDEKLIKKCYWPKDVGHKRAIMQPFESDEKIKRAWHEVELSTILMLFITEMVLERKTTDIIKLEQALEQIKRKNT
jgi:predicted dehydrogenase